MYKVGNSSVGCFTSISYPEDLMTLGVQLDAVSYKASWLKKPVTVYQRILTGPASTAKPIDHLFWAIDITNASVGNQKIEVSAKGSGKVSDLITTYWTFERTTTVKVSFTINPTPTQEPLNNTVWNTKTVDTQTHGTSYSYPVKLDSKGNPHIAFTRYAGDVTFVNYASWNQSGWSFQTVDEGSIIDLLMDSNDMPHLIYSSRSGLICASWTGPNWSKQTVDPNPNCFGAATIDSSGTPYVAYYNSTNLNYAQLSGSSWAIQTIDKTDTTSIPYQIGTVITKNNTQYVLYCYPSEHLDKTIAKMAINDGSGWNTQTVPSTLPITGIGNIVIDTKNQPNFILSQTTNSEVYPQIKNILYYSWAGGNWSINEAASNVSLVNFGFTYNPIMVGSLALDSNDYPHIVYIDACLDSENNSLVYTFWSGSSWNSETVKTETQPYKQAALALDSSGSPHISYIGPVTWSYYYFRSTAPLVYTTIQQLTVTLSPTETVNSQDLSAWAPLGTALIIIFVIAVLFLIYRFHRKGSKVELEV